MEKNKAKNRNGIGGKRGFTLVELSVVLLLLSILLGMTATFTVLARQNNKKANDDVAFLDEVTSIKNAVTAWASERDTEGTVYRVDADGSLWIDDDAFALTEDSLLLGEKKLDGIEKVQGITFSSNQTLIKCTLWRESAGGARDERTFVFAPQCGSITVEVTE